VSAIIAITIIERSRSGVESLWAALRGVMVASFLSTVGAGEQSPLRANSSISSLITRRLRIDGDARLDRALQSQ
jgi:hypothetical protein